LLYLQPAVEVGGAERQASLVLPELPAFGVDPLAVVGPGRAITEWFRASGVGAFAWSPFFPGAGKPTIADLPGMVRMAAALLRELDARHRERPFELVLGSLGYGWAVGGWAARRWGVPLVWRAGGLTLGLGVGEESPRSMAAYGARWMARWLRPSLLLCNAAAVQRYWAEVLPLPSVVVPNAVVVPERVTRLVRRPGEPLRIGFLGRIAPEKELPLLLEACALLRRHGVAFRLRIGGPGPSRDTSALAQRAAALQLERQVRFAGRVDDLTRFLAGCDVLVLPSRVEGSSNVLAEALAQAVPVVATRVGGTPELVRDGRDGLLVEPGRATELAGALSWMAQNPARARLMGMAGRERMKERTPQQQAARLAAILRAVRRGASPTRSSRVAIPPDPAAYGEAGERLIDRLPSRWETPRPTSRGVPSGPRR